MFRFLEKIYFTQRNKSTKNTSTCILYKIYIHIQYATHNINAGQQEASGQPHTDQNRSKLYSLYTSNGRL